MISVGIDAGSISTKGAVLKDGIMVGAHTQQTGYNVGRACKDVLEHVLRAANISMDQVDRVVATGYGRKRVDFADRAVTEITCHAAGVNFLNPEISSIIDIGGQDSKAILLDQGGQVKDFIMNDKCAAGTGRFLEVMARALEVDLDGFGELEETAEYAAKVSSLCTVFAESEVVSLIASGERRANIIAGIHQAIAERVAGMATRIGMRSPVAMTGGVALNSGVVRALERKMGTEIAVSGHAQINGAIGAALLGAG